jgi:hypothetical protein
MNYFDTTSDQIILISYPSGGFGHFLYHVFTHYFHGTVKLPAASVALPDGTNFHHLEKYNTVWYGTRKIPDYKWSPEITVDYLPTDKILVLCDHGYPKEQHDTYWQVSEVFPNAHIIRVCCQGSALPVIYNTFNGKSGFDLGPETEKYVQNVWGTLEDWAVRENFTLQYHKGLYEFKPVTLDRLLNLHMIDFIARPATVLVDLAKNFDLTVINQSSLNLFCKKWLVSQYSFIKVFSTERRLKKALSSDWYNINLLDITNLHDQGYLNYCIERDFDVTIPVYDYKDWFSDTKQIKAMIKKLKHDPN